MSSNAWIVLEGIDGAGTTTQTELLVAHLRGLGHHAVSTREPSGGPIGALLRQALTQTLCTQSGEPIHFEWDTLALLFAADRLDHVAREVTPVLESGGIVVCDRYDLSSVIYQSLTAPEPYRAKPWLLSLNARAPRPDCTIVLSVAEEVARTRREARSARPEIFEHTELQRKLAAEYGRSQDLLPLDRIAVVPGEGDAEQVAVLIRGALAQVPEFAWMGLVQP